MGHYCRICGRSRPNEKFSGKGHRDHICKDCTRLPKAQRDAVDQKEEVYGFLRQSHVSARNITRLEMLTGSGDAEIAEYARIVLEVAKARPYRKQRLKGLAEERPDLLLLLDATGLILAHHHY